MSYSRNNSPDLFQDEADTREDNTLNELANNDPSPHLMPNAQLRRVKYGSLDCYLDFILTIDLGTHLRRIYKMSRNQPTTTTRPALVQDLQTINLSLDLPSQPWATYQLTSYQFTLPSDLTWTYIGKLPDNRMLFTIIGKRN